MLPTALAGPSKNGDVHTMFLSKTASLIILGWFVAVRGLALGGAGLLFLAITCCFSAAISNAGKMWRLITALLCFLACKFCFTSYHLLFIMSDLIRRA